MPDRNPNMQGKPPVSRKRKILLLLVILIVILIIFFGYRGYKQWTAGEDSSTETTVAKMTDPTQSDEGGKKGFLGSIFDKDKEKDSNRATGVKKPIVKIAFILPLSGGTPGYAQYVKRQILSVDVPEDTKYEYQIIVEDGGKTTKSATTKATDMIQEYSIDAVVVLRPDSVEVRTSVMDKGIIPVSISYVMDRNMTSAEKRIVFDPVTLLIDVFERLPAETGKKPSKTDISKALKNYKSAFQAGLPARG